jgi:hypothetical protein
MRVNAPTRGAVLVNCPYYPDRGVSETALNVSFFQAIISIIFWFF